MSIPMVKKLTSAVILGGKPKRPAPNDPPKDLYRIFGVVSGLKATDSPHGPCTALLGAFESVNLATGEQQASGKCYLPDVAGEALIAMVHNSLNSGRDASFKFAFTVGIKPDESSTIGYVYYVKPLMNPGEHDPFVQLKAELSASGAIPALPAAEAPKALPASTPAPQAKPQNSGGRPTAKK